MILRSWLHQWDFFAPGSIRPDRCLTAASRSQSELRPEPQLPGRSALVPESLATQLAVQCRITIHGQLALQKRHSTWHYTAAVSTTAERSHLTLNRNWRANQFSYCLAVEFTARSTTQTTIGLSGSNQINTCHTHIYRCTENTPRNEQLYECTEIQNNTQVHKNTKVGVPRGKKLTQNTQRILLD